MNAKSTYKPGDLATAAKLMRKIRKQPAGGSDNAHGISSLQRQEMQDMLNELNQTHSWRWIARYSIGPTRYGWLQRVADGKRDVKPRYQDLLMVRRLHQQLQDQADLDGARLTLVLDIMRLFGELNVKVSELVKMDRGKA